LADAGSAEACLCVLDEVSASSAVKGFKAFDRKARKEDAENVEKT
jgi:hypothetical protein